MRDPGAWTAPAVDDFVAAAVASPSLAAVHAVAIVATATDPDRSGRGGGAGAVTATNRLAVHVVVDDDGNVAEDGVEVTAPWRTVRGHPHRRPKAGPTSSPESSVALALPSLPVRPDATVHGRGDRIGAGSDRAAGACDDDVPDRRLGHAGGAHDDAPRRPTTPSKTTTSAASRRPDATGPG